jgi:hypothetical protein
MMNKIRIAVIPVLVAALTGGLVGPWTAQAWSAAPADLRQIIITQALDAWETEPFIQPIGVTAPQMAAPEARRMFAVPADTYVQPAVDEKRHSFEVGYEVSNYTYQEKSASGSKIMNLKGNYAGPSLNYTYRPNFDGNVFEKAIDELRLQGRFAWGSVNYTGSLMDGEGITASGIKDHMYELRALVAKSIAVGSGMRVTPYIGLGYRYLFDGQGKTEYGYDRESQYIYLPLGGDAIFRFGRGWSLGLNMEYDHLIAGRQKSHIENVDSGFSSLENKQTDGYGLRGSIKLAKDVSQRVSVFVQPYFRYWNIKQSDGKPLLYNDSVYCDVSGCYDSMVEPKNTTTEVGLKMGVGF